MARICGGAGGHDTSKNPVKNHPIGNRRGLSHCMGARGDTDQNRQENRRGRNVDVPGGRPRGSRRCGVARGARPILTEMRPDKSGTFALGGIAFQVVHKDEGWGPAYQRDLQLDPGYPQAGPDRHEVRGRFKTAAGNYRFSQVIEQTDADTVVYQAEISGKPVKRTNQLCLERGPPRRGLPRAAGLFRPGALHSAVVVPAAKACR